MIQTNKYGQIVRVFTTANTPTGDVLYQTDDGRVWARDYFGYERTGETRGVKIGSVIQKCENQFVEINKKMEEKSVIKKSFFVPDSILKRKGRRR